LEGSNTLGQIILPKPASGSDLDPFHFSWHSQNIPWNWCRL